MTRKNMLLLIGEFIPHIANFTCITCVGLFLLYIYVHVSVERKIKEAENIAHNSFSQHRERKKNY